MSDTERVTYTRRGALDKLVVKLTEINIGWPYSVERYCERVGVPAFAINRSELAAMALRQSLMELKENDERFNYINLHPFKYPMHTASYQFVSKNGAIIVQARSNGVTRTVYQSLVKLYDLPTIFGIRVTSNPERVIDDLLLNPTTDHPRFHPLYEKFKITSFAHVILAPECVLHFDEDDPKKNIKQLQFNKSGGLFLPFKRSREEYVNDCDILANILGIKFIGRT